MEAETQRQQSEKEHQKSAAIFEAAKQKVLGCVSILMNLINLFIFWIAVSVSWERFKKRNSKISTVFWYVLKFYFCYCSICLPHWRRVF